MKNLELLICSLVLVLAGCGGGEGGSDNINFTPNDANFSGFSGQSIPSQTININVGTSSSQRYVGIDNKNTNLVSVTYNATKLDAYTMTITPNSLSLGTYNGTVDAIVCSDSSCTNVIDRGTFKYSITVH